MEKESENGKWQKKKLNFFFLIVFVYLTKQPAGTQLIRPGAYLNDNRGGNNLTPFLASNQVPGPFRPIISGKNYTHDFPNNNNKLNNPSYIRYSNVKESVPLALTHNRHQQQQQRPQQQYAQPQVHRIAHILCCGATLMCIKSIKFHMAIVILTFIFIIFW